MVLIWDVGLMTAERDWTALLTYTLILFLFLSAIVYIISNEYIEQ